MKIYLDFDGTVVEHTYPNIGRVNFGCFEVIKKLQDKGHEVILNTYRADLSEEKLNQALSIINDLAWRFTEDRNNEFDLIPIKALTSKVHPPQFNIEQFIKDDVFFIDDQSNGTPLKPAVMTLGKMVDWKKLEILLKQHDLI